MSKSKEFFIHVELNYTFLCVIFIFFMTKQGQGVGDILFIISGSSSFTWAYRHSLYLNNLFNTETILNYCIPRGKRRLINNIVIEVDLRERKNEILNIFHQ